MAKKKIKAKLDATLNQDNTYSIDYYGNCNDLAAMLNKEMKEKPEFKNIFIFALAEIY